MASRVPGSTTAMPPESDPIFTSLYCAFSCSCNVTVCAPAIDARSVAAIPRATNKLHEPRLIHSSRLCAYLSRGSNASCRQRPSDLLNGSLNVGNFPVHERHFQIFVNPDLLRAEIDDLIRLAESSLHLIGSLPLLNRLRLGLLLRLLRCLLILSALSPLPALSILSALLLSLILLLLRIVADGQQLADRVLDISCARFGERSLRKLENHIRFVVRRRIGLVARIARHDAHRHRVLIKADVDLRRVNLVALGKQFRRLSLRRRLREVSKERLLPRHHQSVGRMHRTTFIFIRKSGLVRIGHTQHATFLDRQ